MMEILYLFREREIREELGIGPIRDAISDTLFPGTSTLHTRAKYMLFIPWIFMKLERQQTPSREIEAKSRNLELSLMRALIYSGEKDGLIGYQARENLKILPSSMYWTGLGVWGLRKFEGTRLQYFLSLDSYYDYLRTAAKSDDGTAQRHVRTNWAPHIIDIPNHFPKGATFNLTREEASYLREKIIANCRDTVLAKVVETGRSTNIDFIWQHPKLSAFSREHLKLIEHARNFSDVMQGAFLLYFMMLHEKRDGKEKDSEKQEMISQWAESMERRMNKLLKWNLEEFWHIIFRKNPHVGYRIRRFVEKWISIVLQNDSLSKIHAMSKARDLIYQREVRIKGKRSRFRNRRMLEQWSGQTGSSVYRFRWGNVQSMVNDIIKGLKGGR
ncbi:MAG: hypothetical protein JXB26_18405 [Candidatus Aminicenantes bacterium]|nr:hypothetical protein [Candidatus Aminicenantes bacterium]